MLFEVMKMRREEGGRDGEQEPQPIIGSGEQEPQSFIGWWEEEKRRKEGGGRKKGRWRVTRKIKNPT